MCRSQSGPQQDVGDQASLSRSRDAVLAGPAGRALPSYWGDEPIWDGHTSIHNPIMDEKGRVWFTARIRPAAEPGFLQSGSDHPSAKVVPLNESARQLSMYDPKTGKWSLIDTCFTTQHLYFAHDADNTLWTSAGGPESGVVGWLNTKSMRRPATRRNRRAGRRSSSTPTATVNATSMSRPNQPLDPKKDKRIMAAFYGVQPSPVDDSIWGQSMDVGFSRMDQPGYIVRLVPGPNPRKPHSRKSICRPMRVTDRAASTSISMASSGPRSRAGILRASTARKCKGR